MFSSRRKSVFGVVLLGLLEEVVDGCISGLFVEYSAREKVLAPPFLLQLALDPDLHEQHLGDFVEGRGGIEMLAIADDVVALVEQVRKFVFLENLQLCQ